MSGGKGGENRSETVNRVPPFQEALGLKNLERADAISAMGPIRNYGATVANFTPTQTASFQNTADAATAFGMQAPTDVMAGMPAAQDFGGISGISAAPVVDDMMARLEANAPGQFTEMTGMYMDPVTGQRPTEGPFQQMSPGLLEEILNNYGRVRIG